MIKKLVLVKDGIAHPINVGGSVTPGNYVLAFSEKNSLIFHSEDGNEITISQGHSDSPDENIFNIFTFERDNGISLGIFELDGENNIKPKSVLHVDKDNGISLNGQKLENVLKEYIDTQDETTLDAAKEYTDTHQDEATLGAAKEYADTQDETTLDTAKEYTEEQIAAMALAKSVDGLTVDGNKNIQLTYSFTTQTAFDTASASIPIGAYVIKEWE
jgi:hypothetical protein